jgi:hypothetical protein
MEFVEIIDFYNYLPTVEIKSFKKKSFHTISIKLFTTLHSPYFLVRETD